MLLKVIHTILLSFAAQEVVWHDSRDTELSTLNLQQVHCTEGLSSCCCSQGCKGSPNCSGITSNRREHQEEQQPQSQQQEGQQQQNILQGPGCLQLHCGAATCSSGEQLRQQQQQEEEQGAGDMQQQHCHQADHVSLDNQQEQNQEQHLKLALQQQQQQELSTAHRQVVVDTPQIQQLQHGVCTQLDSEVTLQQQHQDEQQTQQQSGLADDNAPQQLLQQDSTQQQQQQQLVGLVLNVAGHGLWSGLLGGRHWLAIKYLGGQW